MEDIFQNIHLPSAFCTTSQRTSPWTILICADLGFVSRKPELLSTENWNNVVKRHKIKVQEKIEAFLPQMTQPFSTNLEFSSPEEFSSESSLKKIPALQPLLITGDILTKFVNGEMPMSRAVNHINQCALSNILKNRILKAIDYDSQTKTVSSSPRKIDEILASLDFSAPVSKEGPYPIEKLLNRSGTEPQQRNYVRVRSLIKELNIYAESMIAAVQECPRYFKKKSTWKALELLCKAGQMNGEFYIHSLPRKSAERNFDQILRELNSNGVFPDIVLWNHELDFSPSGAQTLRHLAKTASFNALTLFGSTHESDHFSCGKDFNQLRKEPAFRSLALFSPTVYYKKGPESDEIFRCGAAWLMAEKLLKSTSNGISSHLCNDPEMVFQPGNSFNTQDSLKAAMGGISLFYNPDNSDETQAICTYDAPENRAILRELEYNMLLNRFSKLAATQKICEEITSLKQYLETRLYPFSIFPL